MKAKINNWHGWTDVTRPDVLCSHYKKVLTAAGFKIVNTQTHFLDPYGFTALFLLWDSHFIRNPFDPHGFTAPVLPESHFAIHTFPDDNKTYIELSSCVDAPFQKFIQKIEGQKKDG